MNVSWSQVTTAKIANCFDHAGNNNSLTDEIRDLNMTQSQLGDLLKIRYDATNTPKELRISVSEYVDIDNELKESDDCIADNWEQELIDNFIRNHDKT